MSRSKPFLAVVIGVQLALAAPALSAAPDKKTDPAAGVVGVWRFTHNTPLTSETLIFAFSKRPDGSLIATVDLPEMRRHTELPASASDDGAVRIVARQRPVFEAKRSADGSHLDAKLWTDGGWRPITLELLDERPEFRRPQEPTRPYPYAEEDVTFTNDKAGIRLAGTLTRPRGAGPRCPAVVLLSGSGPDDRDYLAAGHYPFLVLADYLTRRGVAVLRFDDRGVGRSGGDFNKATTEDFAQDAEAAVKYLKRRPDIDPKRVGLIGHSDGGAGAALVASRVPDVAFVVMLAGPGVPGEQIILRQIELGAKAAGSNDQLVAWQVGVQKPVVEALKRSADVAGAEKALRQLVADVNARLTDEDRRRMGVGKDFQCEGITGSIAWLRYFATYDPRQALEKVRCPVLALNGDKDLRMSAAENLSEIERALKSGGNPDYTVKQLPGLNHMFQPCATGLPDENVWVEETLAPEALELVGDWITQRAGLPRPRGAAAEKLRKTTTPDAEIARLLVGKWSGEQAPPGLRVGTITCYRPDGTFDAEATIRARGKVLKVTLSGTWEVSDGVVLQKLTKSSDPRIPLGQDSRMDVLSIDARAFARREDGKDLVETRLPGK
jgi:pimeloyl-ACP methyl ester carboxylesterase